MDPLKLVALDGDDMEVVSAHLQDAVVKVADIRWRPNENRVVVCVDRFDWEAANGTHSGTAQAKAQEFRRRRAVNWLTLGFTYSAMYMGRYNLSFANKSLSTTYGWDKTQVGAIITSALKISGPSGSMAARPS